MFWRRRTITWFVLLWTLLFHYETLRANYLSPLVLRLRSARAPSQAEGLVGRPLPKCPLLFPPAGWIMFFNVDPSYGFAEVYGLRGRDVTLLDPHDILATRAVGYDNIRRNVLIGVLDAHDAPAFCRYLRRKFPEPEAFAVVYGLYPDLVDTPDRILRKVVYQCP